MASTPAAANATDVPLRGRVARTVRRRSVFWVLAVVAGLATGLAIVAAMRLKEERDLKAEQAAILSTEGVFKDLYSRWLDAGGEHDIPATLNGWVKLQNNLFEKWSSPAGERVGVGEGAGAVRAERSTAAGDPSTVRFPVSMKGRISGDGILVGEQLVVRLRLWPDGSVGWRASVVDAVTTEK